MPSAILYFLVFVTGTDDISLAENSNFSFVFILVNFSKLSFSLRENESLDSTEKTLRN